MLGLVTADVARGLDPDLLPFDVACRRRFGDDAVRIISWHDASIEWADFEAVIIRSTWDYTDRLAEFVAWLDAVATQTRLLNPADAIRWSSDKRYLADLAAAGIPIVPTRFVAPGEPCPHHEGLHVVKPTVGAGSVGARRCIGDEVEQHVASLHVDGKVAMVQPYLDLLDERGETSLCFVPGAGGLELSHAFRKGAILTSTDVEQEGGLFAKEQISPRVPSDDEMRLAAALLATEVVGRFDLAYARLDLAPFRAADGTESTVVMEVELIEPSFYLAGAPGAADRFADALAVRLESLGSLA